MHFPFSFPAFVVLLLSLTLIAGCGESSSTPDNSTPGIVPDAADIEFAKAAKPDDPELNRIYSRSCRNCHAVAGVNAPLTGHEEAWAPRLAERGREGLLHSTKFGYRYMPARGLCSKCSDEEYLALIDFMVQPATP